jgi:hypothetical protein
MRIAPVNVGDVFICTNLHKSEVPGIFTITKVEERLIHYTVNGLDLDRSYHCWEGWLRDGVMIHATELIKALS